MADIETQIEPVVAKENQPAADTSRTERRAAAVTGTIPVREVKDFLAAYANGEKSTGNRTAQSEGTDITYEASFIKGRNGMQAIVVDDGLGTRGNLRVVTDSDGRETVVWGTQEVVIKAKFPEDGKSNMTLSQFGLNRPQFSGSQGYDGTNFYVQDQTKNGQFSAVRRRRDETVVNDKVVHIVQSSPVYWKSETDKAQVPHLVGATLLISYSRTGPYNETRAGSEYTQALRLNSGGTLAVKETHQAGSRSTTEVQLISDDGKITSPTPEKDRMFVGIASVSPAGTSAVLSTREGDQYMFDFSPKGEFLNPRKIAVISSNPISTDDVIPVLRERDRATLDPTAEIVSFRAARQAFNVPGGGNVTPFYAEDKSVLLGQLDLQIVQRINTETGQEEGIVDVSRAAEVKVKPDGKFELVRIVPPNETNFGPDGEVKLEKRDRGQSLEVLAQLKDPSLGTFTFVTIGAGSENKEPRVGIQYTSLDGKESTRPGDLMRGLQNSQGLAMDNSNSYKFAVVASDKNVYLQITGEKTRASHLIKLTPELLLEAAYSAE